MAKKTEKITAIAKEKATKRETEVLKAVADMVARGETITFYKVQKETGAAKSYLYSNGRIRAAIEDGRNCTSSYGRKDDSKDAIIKVLRLQIDRLQKEIVLLSGQLDDSYKTKYEKLLAENRQLKLQLKTAYKY